MPVDEPIFYSRPEDYSAHFHDLLRKSVGDRLRGSRVQVFMSGGIDSPTLAATARELLTERHASFDLGAVTQIDGFVPDEQKYAGSIATHLGMHIRYRCWTDRQKLDWEQTRVLVPEPDSGVCFLSRERRFWRSISADSRVFFNGEGPDNALMLDWKPYIAYLARERRYGQMIRSVLAGLQSDRYPPFSRRILGKLRTAVCGSKIPERCYPGWLNPDLESRLHLRERWNSLSTKSPSSHPVRPNAYASFGIPLWQALFERVDSGFTRAALEVRFPFVDIRVLRFLLALPPLPWCRSKYLLRMAMRDRLPKSVLRRRKMTPNARHFREYLAKFCQSRFVPAQQTCEYIDHHRFDRSATCDMVEANLRARSLNHWLYNLRGNSDNAELS